MEKFNILILDEDKNYTEIISRILVEHNFITYTAHSTVQAIDYLATSKVDFFILDVFQPNLDGLQLVSTVKKDHPNVEMIIISSRGSIDNIFKGGNINSIDYIKKPKNKNALFNALERSRDQLKQFPYELIPMQQGSLIPDQIKEKIGRDFIGCSKAMYKVRSLALLAAREKDVNVLITGENGTGKEIIAQVIHYGSARSANKFCPINSAAIPESLIESEFFGHKKGSYTGAIDDKKGCFEMADKGTLFLDEISEMPYNLQAKLLRAIEEKKIKPIGSDQELKVDFRVISATNCKMEDLTNKQKLRIDLFYRLNTFIINIPPLRARPEDIKPLVNYFTRRIALSKNINVPEIQPEVYHHLQNYDYPGNVRELRNMVHRAIIISNGKLLKVKDFHFQQFKKTENLKIETCNIEENEKKLICHALQQTNNNNTKAAKLLGISRDTLLRKKKRYHIDPQ
jgi:DNA-binding NtrC family response regulator